MEVSQQQISYDLKTLQKRWQKSALVDIDAAKSKELARIDHLEREYWIAWERSCSMRVITTAEKRATEKADSTKAGRREEQRDGNPAFLAGIMQCIDRRCKIMGFDAPTKIAPTDPSGEKEYSGGLTVEQRANRVNELLDSARVRRDRPVDGEQPAMDTASRSAD